LPCLIRRYLKIAYLFVKTSDGESCAHWLEKASLLLEKSSSIDTYCFSQLKMTLESNNGLYAYAQGQNSAAEKLLRRSVSIKQVQHYTVSHFMRLTVLVRCALVSLPH
jgi:hypothetical protein